MAEERERPEVAGAPQVRRVAVDIEEMFGDLGVEGYNREELFEAFRTLQQKVGLDSIVVLDGRAIADFATQRGGPGIWIEEPEE